MINRIKFGESYSVDTLGDDFFFTHSMSMTNVVNFHHKTKFIASREYNPTCYLLWQP